MPIFVSTQTFYNIDYELVMNINEDKKKGKS